MVWAGLEQAGPILADPRALSLLGAFLLYAVCTSAFEEELRAAVF
jgi:hypothetical protein